MLTFDLLTLKVVILICFTEEVILISNHFETGDFSLISTSVADGIDV